MSEQTLKFGANEVNKKEFHASKHFASNEWIHKIF